MPLLQTQQQLQAYPTIVANYLKTSFTFAAIGTTALVTTAAPGIYRFNVYLDVTTAQGSQTVTVNALWTDDGAAQTLAVLNAVSTTTVNTYFQGSVIIDNASAANNISFSVTTTATTAVGNIYIVVERLF